MVKYLIFGHYGGCNTGDEAMLAGLVRALSLREPSSICVLTKEGRIPNYLINVDAIGRSALRVIRTIRKVDAVILGGGTHFHDDYVPKRYWRHFRYMFFVASLSWLARLLGKRVYWVGMGFGPFYRKSARLITRFGLKSCHGVTVRDKQSYLAVQPWMHNARLCYAFDLAALLDNVGNEPSDNLIVGSKMLGISVTCVQATASGGKLADATFWPRFACALENIYRHRLALRVLVFVIRGGDREDDKALSHQLVKSLQDIDPERVELIPYLDNPLKTLKLVQDCSFFVATRFHAGVLAYLAGCRLLLLAYHRKVRDLAVQIDLPSCACLPVSQDVRETELQRAIERLLDGDPGYKARLPVKQARQRAMRSIDMVLGKYVAYDK